MCSDRPSAEAGPWQIKIGKVCYSARIGLPNRVAAQENFNLIAAL